MHEFMQDLSTYLSWRGWQLRQETRLPVCAIIRRVEWLVGSLTPPLGRCVQLVFRVTQLDEFYEVHDFEILVRSPDWVGEGAPEEVLEHWEARASSFRQLFRVMEWFRNPFSAFLWEEIREGDWLPPGHWDCTRLGSFVEVADTWERCTNVEEMLRQLRGCGLSARKLLLLACALCRGLPLAMLHENNRHAVAVAVRYAEEACLRRELKKACKPSGVSWLWNREPFEAVAESLRALGREGGKSGWDGGWIAGIIRDVTGNPFRPVSVRRQWLKSNEAAVQQMAEAIAAEQAFDHLPVLGDALEDAGCTEAAILDHCRGSGPHVPGCWLLDLLRGKN
jgi:hypothetical protein